MASSSPKTVLAAISAIALAGCGSVSGGGGDGGGGSGGGGGGASDAGAVARNLSCLQILQCVVDCPDEMCADVCLANGSAAGQTNVIALATCIENQGCTDAPCIESQCSGSLDVCVGSSAPSSGGTPLTGTAPPGSIPANLVGTWSGARDGITQTMTLNADGSGSWMSGITWQQYACMSFKRTTRTGNFVFQEPGSNAYGQLKVYATSVLTTERTCAPPDRETVGGARTEELLWSRPDDPTDTNTIYIVDMECAAPHLAKPGWQDCKTYGCPIGMYCTSRLTRN